MHSNPLLSGTIPDSLGSLSGTIPDSLGILDQLVRLGSLDQLVDLLMAERHRTRQPRKPRSACAPVHVQQPFAEWHPTRQPRKPQPASVAAHAQQPFAEWHRTRQPRKPRANQLVYLYMYSNPASVAASESSISLCT
eukprot:TRINITY_DN2008_c0_g1_i85.p1 TRINITY_DN2008_c0_g1~~TRINITY_DN2008_c0_g1_i85.p1  ORF type:complete len:137 (+),score=19.22 TRINITY_DN2008_c0_g1_i85:374-784(+)